MYLQISYHKQIIDPQPTLPENCQKKIKPIQNKTKQKENWIIFQVNYTQLIVSSILYDINLKGNSLIRTHFKISQNLFFFH
jgi:hypothetical protein